MMQEERIAANAARSWLEEATMVASVLAAARFAAALDEEDYLSAGALLAEGCVYYAGASTLVGADAIIGSYRGNGEAARRRFGEVEYFSHVESKAASAAVIVFTDRVRLGGQWHEFRCRQHVAVDERGLIVEIRHEEIPTERERLEDFERRHSERRHRAEGGESC